VLPNSHRHSLAWIDTCLFHSALDSPFRAPQFLSVLLSQDGHSSLSFLTWFPPPFPHSPIPTGAPQSGLSFLYWIPHSLLPPHPPHPPHPPPFRCSSASTGAPQSSSALLSLDLALFFILRSFNTFCVLLFSTQNSPSGAPLFLGGCSPFSYE